MVDFQSAAAEIRRGKKKKERKKIETTGQKYNGLPFENKCTKAVNLLRIAVHTS